MVNFDIFLSFQCPILAAILVVILIVCVLHDIVGSIHPLIADGKWHKILLSPLSGFQACGWVLAN